MEIWHGAGRQGVDKGARVRDRDIHVSLGSTVSIVQCSAVQSVALPLCLPHCITLIVSSGCERVAEIIPPSTAPMILALMTEKPCFSCAYWVMDGPRPMYLDDSTAQHNTQRRTTHDSRDKRK